MADHHRDMLPLLFTYLDHLLRLLCGGLACSPSVRFLLVLLETVDSCGFRILASLTVRAEDVSTRLAQVMAEHGVALVTGVLSPAEVQAMEHAFDEDLAALVDVDKIKAGSSESTRAAHERFVLHVARVAL